MYFTLTGTPPFGDGPGETILARQLSETLSIRLAHDGFADALAEWLQRGLAPRVEDRFGDAEEMRVAWRQVVRALRRAEDARPWWRRLIEGAPEDGEPAPTSGW